MAKKKNSGIFEEGATDDEVVGYLVENNVEEVQETPVQEVKVEAKKEAPKKAPAPAPAPEAEKTNTGWRKIISPVRRAYLDEH